MLKGDREVQMSIVCRNWINLDCGMDDQVALLIVDESSD
jgi:hypothetical protein